MGVIGLNALSRLGWGRLEGSGKWRSTDSYRNPQFVTANVNGLRFTQINALTIRENTSYPAL